MEQLAGGPEHQIRRYKGRPGAPRRRRLGLRLGGAAEHWGAFGTCTPAACEDHGWRELRREGELPPGRYAHSAIFDPKGRQMVVFGGQGGRETAPLFLASRSFQGETPRSLIYALIYKLRVLRGEDLRVGLSPPVCMSYVPFNKKRSKGRAPRLGRKKKEVQFPR